MSRVAWPTAAAGPRSRLARADALAPMLWAANEQDAIAGAMADCAKRDSACRVIGIGPFAVEAN